MPYYTPPEGADNSEGLGLLKVAIRDFLLSDPTIVETLHNDPDWPKAIEEGLLDENMPTPVLMFGTVGDGDTDTVGAHTLVRLIVYVVDRGRGLSRIEKALHRVRRRINDTEAALEFLQFDKEQTGMSLIHIAAKGSTASVSLPAWKAEARGAYVFSRLEGFQSSW